MNKKWLYPWLFSILLCLVLGVGVVWWCMFVQQPAIESKKAADSQDVVMLARNMYFHRGETNTDGGRKAVTAVVFNRMADKAKRWPRTVVGVIQDGHERGKNCDFSWTCDGLSDTPGNATRYAHDLALARQWLLEYKRGAFKDPTSGATWFLFKEDRPPASWPTLEQAGTYGMYTFYRYTTSTAVPPPRIDQDLLKGSRGAVRRAYQTALKEKLTFAPTYKEVLRLVMQGKLVKVIPSDMHAHSNVSLPYLHPVARLFLERLSAQYHQACGEKLVVTSMVRPAKKKLWNGSKFSVHPTGIAMDFRIPGSDCKQWLEATLLTLEKAGVVEATREWKEPHYHIVVFPSEYTKYVRQKTAKNN